MAVGNSNYPTALDNYTEATANDVISSVNINNLQAAIEATQAHVGTAAAGFPNGLNIVLNSAVANLVLTQAGFGIILDINHTNATGAAATPITINSDSQSLGGSIMAILSNGAALMANIIYTEVLNAAASTVNIKMINAGVGPAIFINYTGSPTTAALKFDGCTVANGAQNITISNVGPAGIGTATISKWLTFDEGGVVHYIAVWT